LGLSPFKDEERELRQECEFLLAELRWPYTTEAEAIARTLENYPQLTRDEISSWWRIGEFRRRVKESRAVAAEYAAEDTAGVPVRSPYTTANDPYAVSSAHAYGSPGGFA